MHEATVTADGTAVRIQPGRALVLVGPNRDESALLAQAIAKRVGDAIDQADAGYLSAWHHLGFHATGRDVLIVHGWPAMLNRPMNWGALVELIAATAPHRTCRACHLVFLLTPQELPARVAESRRFHIVHMPRKGHGVVT